MLLTRHATPLTDVSPASDIAARGGDTEPKPPIPIRPWTRALQRLSGLLTPRHAARKGLLQLDDETTLAGSLGHIEGCPEHRETLALRGRRVQIVCWGDPRRQPYVLLPPLDATGRDAMAAWVRRRTSHQPHGTSTRLAPTMRNRAMSNGPSVRWAEARAMMMNPVQMVTVTKAARRPMARGDRRIGRLSAGDAEGCGQVQSPDWHRATELPASPRAIDSAPCDLPPIPLATAACLYCVR